MAQNVWSGDNGNGWGTPSNWGLSRAPNGTDDILIPAECNSYPTIPGGTSVLSITIEAGAVLTTGGGNFASGIPVHLYGTLNVQSNTNENSTLTVYNGGLYDLISGQVGGSKDFLSGSTCNIRAGSTTGSFNPSQCIIRAGAVATIGSNTYGISSLIVYGTVNSNGGILFGIVVKSGGIVNVLAGGTYGGTIEAGGVVNYTGTGQVAGEEAQFDIYGTANFIGAGSGVSYDPYFTIYSGGKVFFSGGASYGCYSGQMLSGGLCVFDNAVFVQWAFLGSAAGSTLRLINTRVFSNGTSGGVTIEMDAASVIRHLMGDTGYTEFSTALIQIPSNLGGGVI